MQIEVIYRDGVFVPTVSLRVKRKRLSISVSENEVQVLDAKQEERRSTAKTPLRQQLDYILGPYARSRPRVAPTEDRANWHTHLEEKHLL